MNWTKVVGPGLPHYVNGKLDPTVGRSSAYSFRFDLNGGSLIYRYDPASQGGGGKIPVKAGALYRVEGYVKTTALENARARISAYFVDRDLHPLVKTVHHSALVPSKEETPDETGWTKLTVMAHCDDPKAAYLVVELGLLQPTLYAPSNLGARTLFNQDVTGSAWFTDVSVSHVPEVAVSSESVGSVFPRGTPVVLTLKITDREASDLTLRLEVRDAEGNLVHQRTGPLDAVSDESGLEHRMSIPVPALPAGWYLARITLTSHGREVAMEDRAFVQLPDAGQIVAPDARFGAIATGLSPRQWRILPTLLPLLGTGRVKIAIWGENADIQTQDAEEFDRLLERLQEAGVLPTACITALPPELAATVGSDSLARLPRVDEKVWKPRLNFLIARHANHLDRWQLGTDGQDNFVTDPAYRRAYDEIFDVFKGLVHSPDVAIPWPATFETDRKLPSTVAISLPATVLPEQVPLYISDTKERGGKRLSLTLLPLDARYGQRAQIRDFAQRIVTSLAGQAERIDINLPFTPDGQPDQLFLPIRTLHQSLTGTIFRGKLNVADNVEAYLFERNGHGVLALWDKGPRMMSDDSAQTPSVRLNLGGKPRLVDMYGNVSPLRQATAMAAVPVTTGGVAGATPNANTPASGGPDVPAIEPGSVLVPLGDLPVLVDEVDPALALFRVSVKIDNPLLESSFAPHTRKITFTNTFPDFLSGTVSLKAPKGWTISPPSLNFNLNPGESFTADVNLEIPYNTLAGAKPIQLRFDIPNINPNRFTVPIELRLGLNEVGLQTLALRDGNDVMVQVLITNYGQRTINYSAFALLPGAPRQERLVTGLGPGRTTVKRFRFPYPEKAMAGSRIRVGLREMEGTRILNDEVAVP
jgi:hypothetical protein